MEAISCWGGGLDLLAKSANAAGTIAAASCGTNFITAIRNLVGGSVGTITTCLSSAAIWLVLGYIRAGIENQGETNIGQRADSLLNQISYQPFHSIAGTSEYVSLLAKYPHMSNNSHEASEQYPVIEGIMKHVNDNDSNETMMVYTSYGSRKSVSLYYDMNLYEHLDWLLDNSELAKRTDVNSAYYTADQVDHNLEIFVDSGLPDDGLEKDDLDGAFDGTEYDKYCISAESTGGTTRKKVFNGNLYFNGKGGVDGECENAPGSAPDYSN